MCCALSSRYRRVFFLYRRKKKSNTKKYGKKESKILIGIMFILYRKKKTNARIALTATNTKQENDRAGKIFVLNFEKLKSEFNNKIKITKATTQSTPKVFIWFINHN